jgi:HD-like signal output (HDOD) protein
LGGNVLELLASRVEGRGDLPVFRTSVLEVIRLGEDTQCAASDIARIILQDQGFAVKVLRIANSPYYNRTNHSIKTISRAVVLLGVEVIRDICLGLGFVEVFQRHHPWIDLKKILARSYFTGTLARELAGLARDSRKEELFVRGLLQYLGKLAVAYYLPERYLEVEQLRLRTRCPEEEAQQQVLGHTYQEFAEALAERWSLPMGLVKPVTGGLPSGESDLRLATIPRVCFEVAENLFGEGPRDVELAGKVEILKQELHVAADTVLDAICGAYTEARKSSARWGIEARELKAVPAEPDDIPDPARKELVRRLQQVERREEVLSQVELLEQEGQVKDRATIQLELLREISLHIFENRDLSTLFDLVMEGIQRVAQFDRIVLALCNPERTVVTGRYGLGLRAGELAGKICIQLDADNLFTRCLRDRQPILVLDAEQEPLGSLLPPYLKQVFSATAFALAPIYSAEKLVGFFYADNAVSKRPISLEDYRCFEHFSLQANLGLDRHRLRM